MTKTSQAPALSRRCAGVAAALVALVTSLSSGRCETFLDEQFADEERATQNLPGSAAWFLEASSSAHSSSVVPGAWTILPPAPPSKISALSYFRAAPITLRPGESLSVSLRIRSTHQAGTFRVGFFQSGGSRAGGDVIGNSSLFAKYQGYDVTCTPAVGTTALSRRTKSIGGLWTTSAFQPLALTTEVLPAETGYAVSLTVECAADGKMLITSDVAGIRCAVTEATGLSSFDTVAVQVDGAMGATGLQSIQVKKGPDATAAPSEEKVATSSLQSQPVAMTALTGGSTWYLQAMHTGTLNWHSASTWFSATAGGGTNPTAIASTDTFHLNGFRAYSPMLSSGTATFGGGEIVMSGTSTLTILGSNGTTVVIPQLVSTGGTFMNNAAATQYHVIPRLSAPSGSLTFTKFNATNRTNVLTSGTVSGAGGIAFSGNGAQQIQFDDAYQFTGPLIVSSCTLSFLNNVATSGPLQILPLGKVNLTQSISVSALTVTGSTVVADPGNLPRTYTYPPGTYSYAVLSGSHPTVFVGGSGTATITVRGTQTYYLRINQSGTNSWTNAFRGDWNSLPNGLGTAAPAINPLDDYSTNGKSLRTPLVSDTFLGRTLLLENGAILLKHPQREICTIPSLVAASGTIQHYVGTAGTSTLRVNFYTQNSGTTTLSAIGGQTVDLNVDYLSGSGNIRFAGAGQSALNVIDASQFSGTYTQTSGTLRLSPITSGPVHAVNSIFAMKGRLVVNAGAKVVLNRHAYVGALTVSGTVKPNGTYPATSLGFTGSCSITVYTPDLAGPPQMFGINFASGTFDSTGLQIPTIPEDWDFYRARGQTLVRVPVNWQQMQRNQFEDLYQTNMSRLSTVLALANARGMKVIIDMHNFGVYKDNTQVIGTVVPYSAYQDAWEKISAYFATDANKAALFGFDIMNEPAGIPGNGWQTALKYAIAGIRKNDMTSYIIVEGKVAGSSRNWVSENNDMGAIDPACRVIYSAHSYWSDRNTHEYLSYATEGAYPNIGADLLRPFVEWTKKRKFYGFVGEYGVPYYQDEWKPVLRNALQYMRDNGISGTYWANGRHFGNYLLCVDTGTTPLQERRQMDVLEEFRQP